MAFQPDDLLTEAALEAAVALAAERNQHHLADMSAAEQSDAVGHWRELAMTVLTAARTAAGADPGEGETGGRAAIVLKDAGGDEITVHASSTRSSRTSGAARWRPRPPRPPRSNCSSTSPARTRTSPAPERRFQPASGGLRPSAANSAS